MPAASARRACSALVLALVALAVARPGAASAGTTYYVSPAGSDTASGTAVTAPWRTVGRVNRACPAPGDTVLFQGGAVFNDATLMPACSGTAFAPITFGSYGVGKAQLALGVWFQGGDHDLVLDGLDLTSPSAGVVASAASGSGVANITVSNSIIHDTSATGVYAQPQDSGWKIVGNTISHTGDSGIVDWSPGMLVASNTITDTGWNEPALGYATHGVYAKGADMTIRDNDLSANRYGQSLSLRAHGIRAYGNSIHDTPYAVGFFNYDHQQNSGTIYVYENRMWNVSGYVFYYNGTTDAGAASGIDAVFDSNTALVTNGGEGVNLSEMTGASAEVANNVFFGSIGSGYRGCATCSEHHNDWSGVAANRPAGAGDSYAAPQVAAPPSLAPLAGSALVDHGSAAARLPYTGSCRGVPLDYCGVAPDQGAVELASAVAAADTAPPTPPTGLSASAVTSTGLTLSWQPASDDVGVAGYAVAVSSAAAGTTASTTYAVGGLSCGTTYSLTVVAYDAAGNRSAPASVTAATTTCALPRPTVAITAPTDGGHAAATFAAAATASSAAGVSRVSFSVAGGATCVDSSAPYGCTLTTTRGWHTLTATVVDAAGGAASTSIRFQVTTRTSTTRFATVKRAAPHARRRSHRR
ncbi:MAG TPA: Ig-like domain-containing protein [Gaiellaceae bacterium]